MILHRGLNQNRESGVKTGKKVSKHLFFTAKVKKNLKQLQFSKKLHFQSTINAIAAARRPTELLWWGNAKI